MALLYCRIEDSETLDDKRNVQLNAHHRAIYLFELLKQNLICTSSPQRSSVPLRPGNESFHYAREMPIVYTERGMGRTPLGQSSYNNGLSSQALYACVLDGETIIWRCVYWT